MRFSRSSVSLVQAPKFLSRRLAGLRGDISNSVKVDGQPLKLDSIRSSLKAGIAYVAEDRADKGVFLDAPIAINITASVMAKFSKAGIMRRAGEQEEARRLASMFAIDPKRLPHEVSTLSGGNQQKVSLAKAVALAPRLLLLNEPTRGVDIGARAEIYSTLRKMADDGLAIVFYSTDLEEILELADTVLTVFRGRMSAISLDLKSMVTRCSTTSSRAIATHLTDMSLSETNPRRWVMHKTALEPTAQVSPTALRRWASALFGTTSIHAASIRIATLVLIIVAAAIVPHFTEFGNVQSLMYSVRQSASALSAWRSSPSAAICSCYRWVRRRRSPPSCLQR